MDSIIQCVIYFAVGMAFCAIGYKVFDLILPFDLNKEIDNHNIAAGLAVAGMFIAIAMVISTAMV